MIICMPFGAIINSAREDKKDTKDKINPTSKGGGYDTPP